MKGYGYIDEATQIRGPATLFGYVTIGQVVDTNDPQQMGRVRALCPVFGDNEDMLLENLPWATYVSPFAGSNEVGSRGRGDDETSGRVAYGMFNVPKVGSMVLVACIDGDPRFRVWMGCLHDQYLPHTLPHGRYTYKDVDEPSGPWSSEEEPIQPLYDQQTEAFTNTDTGVEARKSFEFRTRGADRTVAGLGDDFVENDESTISFISDDRDETVEELDGNSFEHTQGYDQSRINPDLIFEATGKNFDPQTYSWTTPGFHSIAMDDRADNCRVRFRTTHGQQIILDDTNERIYVSTASGKGWFEIDEKGNLDVYVSRNISYHAEQDINFTAGGAFRVTADQIHLAAENEFRIHSKGSLYLNSDNDMYVEAKTNLHTKVGSSLYIKTEFETHLTAFDVYLTAENNFNIDAGTEGFFTTGSTLHFNASGDIIQSGNQIFFNGPPAQPATPADFVKVSTDFKESWLTSRVPDHEPWARVMTDPIKTDQDLNNTHDDAEEYSYNDSNVGRVERGIDLNRNPRWHR